MSAKTMVLADLPELCPGTTRPGIERVLQILDQQPATDRSGLSVASALMPIVPGISARLSDLSGDEVDDYLRVLRGAATFVLQLWTTNGRAPRYASVKTAVEAIEG
jgi:hypothetical protein